jgi:thiamine biosynthesis lipoprotein
MGTTLDVAVVAGGREAALGASEGAIAEIRRVEDLLTTWRDSPLARLNRAEAGSETPLAAELCAVLSQVLPWAERTGHAFDPTVAPLVRAWGLRGAGRIPSRRELFAARASTGAGSFRVDPERCSAVRLRSGAGIDEGAWGKGYALDRAADRLAAAGAGGWLIDLGGQALARGRDASGRPWTIAIAHPRDRERPVVSLALHDASASTSGNSERGRTVGGRRIGHELDPRTGEPAPDFGSVTVVAASGLTADILSTAFFVLGPERGLALSERLRREGVGQEVLFLVDRGQHLEAVASPGLSKLVLSADPAIVGGLLPATTPQRRTTPCFESHES